MSMYHDLVDFKVEYAIGKLAHRKNWVTNMWQITRAIIYHGVKFIFLETCGFIIICWYGPQVYQWSLKTSCIAKKFHLPFSFCFVFFLEGACQLIDQPWNTCYILLHFSWHWGNYGTKTKEIIYSRLNLNAISYVLFPKPRWHAPELTYIWIGFSLSTGWCYEHRLSYPNSSIQPKQTDIHF